MVGAGHDDRIHGREVATHALVIYGPEAVESERLLIAGIGQYALAQAISAPTICKLLPARPSLGCRRNGQ